ncbi:MAG: winged helix DNA-binding protein [Eubacterium sp.]|nr:winged helix DNA-binding protein [Eubacterium sp.]
MNIDKVAILVKKAALQAEKIQNPILQEYDLTVSQYKFLKYLYRAEKNSVRIADLEKYYSMTHPAAIDILKVLEKKGYTVRTVNPEDARSKIVSLTEKAYAEQAMLEALGNQMESAVTQQLTEKERTELIRLLKKLLGI